MLKSNQENILHKTFLFTILIRGIDGILELIAGFILLLAKSDLIVKFISRVFRHEIAQDPTDFFANYIINSSQSLSHKMILFASLYLIIYGIVKISLVTGLLLKKKLAYPIAGVIIGILLLFQIFKLLISYSNVLLILTIIDLVILVLLKHEYKRLKFN